MRNLALDQMPRRRSRPTMNASLADDDYSIVGRKSSMPGPGARAANDADPRPPPSRQRAQISSCRIDDLGKFDSCPMLDIRPRLENRPMTDSCSRIDRCPTVDNCPVARRKPSRGCAVFAEQRACAWRPPWWSYDRFSWASPVAVPVRRLSFPAVRSQKQMQA
jgi:hypothetical protein